MLVKVNGTKMVRDTKSMALINTDNTEKNEYYSKVRLLQNQKSEINNVKAEMASIRGDVAEVKQLLMKLLEGTNV
jgi:hypothetical protein